MIDYNEIVSPSVRKRLNSQKNRVAMEGKITSEGVIIEPWRFVIGLGEKHFRQFEQQLEKICSPFPWTRKKYIRFIMHELILNSQFSMLREVVRHVKEKSKVAGYFHVTVFLNNDFFSASIEEFGDFFDYYGYIDRFSNELYGTGMYDEIEENTLSLHELAADNIKFVLKPDDRLIVPDGSNQIGLNVIENATDRDFYVTSFYKENKYMWKRVYFRVENDLEAS